MVGEVMTLDGRVRSAQSIGVEESSASGLVEESSGAVEESSGVVEESSVHWCRVFEDSVVR